MADSTFRLQITVPRQVAIEKKRVAREEFFEWVWRNFSDSGLVGVHEGTLLSEQASEQGFETESWTVDAGEAPRERDWVESQKEIQAELYFSSREHAEDAADRLKSLPDLGIGRIEEQKPEDWDAQWKASFLGSPDGVVIPPFWRIVPPWTPQKPPSRSKEVILRINPGAGFGTGTHETTQLCLQAIAENMPKKARVLDFGSGSGILTIGAALLGGDALGVEIDPLAVDNARDNAQLNQFEGKVRFAQDLSAADGRYDLVIANILKPVLLEFADKLVERLEPAHGVLILSGLIENDVAPVSARFGALLDGRKPEKRDLNEWRALIWKARS